MTGPRVTLSIGSEGCVVVSGPLVFFWEISCLPENTRRPSNGGCGDHQLKPAPTPPEVSPLPKEAPIEIEALWSLNMCW